MSPEKEKKLKEQVLQLASLGVTDHGLVGHEELNQAYSKASLWTYPCIADETFCITALRAQLSGALPVVIMGSALKETVRNGFICQTREQYKDLLMQALEKASSISLEERRQLGAFIKQTYTWKVIAQKWHELFSLEKSKHYVAPQKAKTICLNMIVKNEASVICRCLASVKDLIDEWVIVDTGSNDGTQELICEFLKDKKGNLYERPWVNFEYNRNEALDLAKGRADYIMFIDADEILKCLAPFDKTQLKEDLYLNWVQEPGTACFKTFMIKDGLPWKWKGVIHERIVCPIPYTQTIFSNIVNISTTADGFRSKNPNKYLDDAKILEEELKKDPDDPHNLYFLAQSYALGHHYEKSLDAFSRCSKVAKNPEVVWFSKYVSTRIQENQKMITSSQAIQAYCAHFFARPSRAEPLYYVGRVALLDRNFILAYVFSKFARTLPFPVRDVNSHVEYWIYDYGLLCMQADAALNLGKALEAKELYQELLQKKEIPNHLREEVKEILSKIDSCNLTLHSK